MELTTCARPYARAAFQFAAEQNALENWAGMLKTGAAVVQNDTVNVLLGNPSLTAAQKADALIDVCGDSLDDSGRNFFHVLADNKRITLLPQISELFEELKAKQEQSVEAEVISAFPLSEPQLATLTEKLKNRLKTEIRISNTIDESLLGGVIIRAGDLVIDSSVKARLAKLADAMRT
ncbi:F0F1 ATP synthase subunit delta [Parendozoicomonas haliclonae]|uniref:ATP synthase subunit delta n=1 Tax=Parendozoicomonas haliclonae TaxID=1960125 RepID=A0A1X7AK73_9GAMM|nr:F0F1 ATP synthase subunit delta [Parendozoicomonas haliclonae]SMA46559.1 ATP synthase subunit delta [Parendozoicomonas haliclonae]